MKNLTVYQFDEKQHFTAPLVLDASDRSPSGAWNIPARCVQIAPPAAQDGYKIKWNGENWEYEEETQEDKPEEHEPTLDELKQSKIFELKAARDTAEVQPIEYNGNSFDYDEKARERINAAIIALELQGEGASIDWTTADNTDVKVTAQDLRMVIGAIAARSNSLHVAYRQAREAVEAAGNEAELAQIALEDYLQNS